MGELVFDRILDGTKLPGRQSRTIRKTPGESPSTIGPAQVTCDGKSGFLHSLSESPEPVFVVGLGGAFSGDRDGRGGDGPGFFMKPVAGQVLSFLRLKFILLSGFPSTVFSSRLSSARFPVTASELHPGLFATIESSTRLTEFSAERPSDGSTKVSSAGNGMVSGYIGLART